MVQKNKSADSQKKPAAKGVGGDTAGAVQKDAKAKTAQAAVGETAKNAKAQTVTQVVKKGTSSVEGSKGLKYTKDSAVAKGMQGVGAVKARRVRGRQNIVKGRVVSSKADKTISVLVYRLMKHPKYKKYIRRQSVFKAHDEKNSAKTGDNVFIYETRPGSRTKRWKLLKIDKHPLVAAEDKVSEVR